VRVFDYGYSSGMQLIQIGETRQKTAPDMVQEMALHQLRLAQRVCLLLM
jgi:hypothetical protein